VSGRVRCTNGQGQAPHMGANGKWDQRHFSFLIVFTLTGRREEFQTRPLILCNIAIYCTIKRVFAKNIVVQ